MDENNFDPKRLNIEKIREKMISLFGFLDELYNRCYDCNLNEQEKQSIQVFVIEGIDYWYQFITDELEFTKDLHLDMSWNDYQNLILWVKKIELLKNKFKNKIG